MTLRHPFANLTEFPTRTCNQGTVLWRITATEYAHTPWWFTNTGNGRFDLNPHSGHGTCYMANSPLGCLLETVWRDAEPTGDPNTYPPLAPSEVGQLSAVEVEVTSDYRCADVTGVGTAQLNIGFGITDAIGTCSDYLIPQQWAAAWHAHNLDGAAYRLAHGTGLHGWAFFGTEGSHTAHDLKVHPVSEQLLAMNGVPPEPAVSSTDLEDVDDPDAARRYITDRFIPLPRLESRATWT